MQRSLQCRGVLNAEGSSIQRFLPYRSFSDKRESTHSLFIGHFVENDCRPSINRKTHMIGQARKGRPCRNVEKKDEFRNVSNSIYMIPPGIGGFPPVPPISFTRRISL